MLVKSGNPTLMTLPERLIVDLRVANEYVVIKIWHAAELGSAELLRGSFSDYAYDPHSHDAARSCPPFRIARRRCMSSA